MAAPPAEVLLRQHGLRVTPQRRRVLTLFLQNPGYHGSADQVRDQLLPDLPELARGTTYKVLNELVRLGVLEEIPTWDGTVLYGLRLEPHHHFYCEVCRRWFDVQVAGVDALSIEGPSPAGSVDRVDVTVRGICRECQASRSAGL
jgi:Fe2+ or Zn2+ uptake regulation protein